MNNCKDALLINNYKALKFHVIICIFSCLSYGFTARFINKNILSITVLLILVLYLLGGLFMENLGLGLENFKSVSLISALGVIIWIISIALIGLGPISSNPNWIVYGFYTFYFLPILDIFKISSPFVYLIASLIPTILMWAGMELAAIKRRC